MSSAYGQASIELLKEKQGYEVWLLNYLRTAAYGPEEDSKLKIDEDGKVVINLVVKEVFGQSGVKKVVDSLFPLMFVSAYGLIDSIFEWILAETKSAGKISEDIPRQYQKRVDMVKNKHKAACLEIPPFFASENMVFDILIALYEQYRTFRNGIVHQHTYTLKNNELEILDKHGQSMKLSSEELFAFTHAVVRISNILQGEKVSEKALRDIKSRLDVIRKHHGGPQFGLAKPSGVVVEHTVQATGAVSAHGDKWLIDMGQVWSTFKRTHTELEDFYYKLLGKRTDGTTVAWLIPSERLPQSGTVEVVEGSSDWGQYKVIE